jgi:hypothetical protein
MKTEEDEAFDDIARRQGAWGGGFQAKRQMAMDKINSDFDEEYKKMHEDRIKYGTAWSQDGKRIDPMSVYKEQPAQEPLAVYGYCPECGAKGVMRERRLNGNDKCAKGHTYPSNTAAPQPAQEPPKYAIKAYWEDDGRIGVVATVERPDGGFHLLGAIIDPPPVKEKNT